MKNLEGQTFGRLTVIKATNKRKHGSVVWTCLCQCGNTVEVTSNCLIRGKTKSCGCYKIESRKNNCRKTFLTHGQTKTKLYGVWQGMKKRCYCPTDKAYKNYGGRGIHLHESWLSFENFREWSIQNGYKEGLTIERIDVNKNYEPSNCTWISLKRQARNRRTTHYLSYNGETLSITEWAEKTGIPRRTISKRINDYGWSIERALKKGDGRTTSFS